MTISPKYVAAALGFAFVAVWLALDFGQAVLCLLGAGAFYLVAGVVQGDVRLAEMQERFGSRRA